MRLNRAVLTSLCIFCAALGVRLISWIDNYREALRVEWGVTDGYYRPATQLLLDGRFAEFLRDPNAMAHPPGYSILLAAVASMFGGSNAAMQFVQIAADAAAAVVVFLIATELVAPAAAAIAGALAAVSPQLAYYPSLLLPDSLAVLPILLAVYALIRGVKRPSMALLALAGALAGVSCWLRANALLLGAFLGVAAWLLLMQRAERWRGAAVVVLAAVLVIAPITVKNAVVFHQFIPLSLGAGQKLLQGVAEYDAAGSLGVPKTDLGIIRQEMEALHRPDYAQGLFVPDGPLRDRMRVARGVAVIAAHPFWYAGVMMRRAASFLQLAQVPIALPQQSPTHAAKIDNGAVPAWLGEPPDLIAHGTTAAQAKVSASDDGKEILLAGDDSKYGAQMTTAPIALRSGTDYVSRLSVRLEQGRMIVNVVSDGDNRVLATMVVDLLEGVSAGQQPEQTLEMPFASGDATAIRIVVRNGGAAPRVRIGAISLFELGGTGYLWTRIPRLLLRNVQRLFLTAWMLPLELAGIGLLIRRRQWMVLTVLLTVPAYYMSVESALHTERRYVIAIHYFLLIAAALSLYELARAARRAMRGRAARSEA